MVCDSDARQASSASHIARAMPHQFGVAVAGQAGGPALADLGAAEGVGASVDCLDDVPERDLAGGPGELVATARARGGDQDARPGELR